ncbi:MAG: SPOR domain-containing protein [Bacteroidetes bacterium]|nr:SPOR domain-containing protein [Bacteroidota bacterium]
MFLIIPGLHAQTVGNVEIIQDEKVDELLKKHVKVNEVANTIPGFRINIFFQSGNNSKAGAMQCKSNFIAKYPDIEAYVVYEEPNFKVKVGDFRTRMEARGFVQQIKMDFPDAFVIKDLINFPKITE